MTNSNNIKQSEYEELEKKIVEIVALIPMQTGAKLTEIGWERYSENEQDAIKDLTLLVQQERLKAKIEELMHIDPDKRWYDGTGDYELVEHRIAELNKQLEEMNRG